MSFSRDYQRRRNFWNFTSLESLFKISLKIWLYLWWNNCETVVKLILERRVKEIKHLSLNILSVSYTCAKLNINACSHPHHMKFNINICYLVVRTVSKSKHTKLRMLHPHVQSWHSWYDYIAYSWAFSTLKKIYIMVFL